jgi:hypothetical protein
MKKLFLIALLTLSFSSFAEIRCDGQLWTLQEVITPIDSYQVIITKYDCTRWGEYIDGQLYENGKPFTPSPGLEGYLYSGQIIDNNNNIVVDFIGANADELSIVDTPEGFPLLTLLISFYGASNTSHTYLLYSTSPVLKKVAEIRSRIVEGFYQDSDDNFLLDTVNGCTLFVPCRSETFKLVDGNMVSLGITD